MNQPLSHTLDPATSYEAADRMVRSGELEKQEQEVYNDISRYIIDGHHKDYTPKELAHWQTGNDKENYYRIERRQSGLCNKGYIERISINNNGNPPWERRNGCCVWRLK